MMELMSSKRLEAQKAIMKRVQYLADYHKLGVQIETLLILDAHPPIEKVAPAYQEVIGAMEQRETAILNAEAYKIKTLPEAQAEAARIIAEAKSYRATTGKVAQAESERFTKQLTAYRAMPSVFKLRELLNFLAVDCAGIRKYVVPLNSESEVYELNFESKERLDLIDTDVTKLSNK
jgi:membrane protease subunit HflK